MTSPEAAPRSAAAPELLVAVLVRLAGGGSALLALRIGESEQGTERRLAASPRSGASGRASSTGSWTPCERRAHVVTRPGAPSPLSRSSAPSSSAPR